jgi:hypothetical protein
VTHRNHRIDGQSAVNPITQKELEDTLADIEQRTAAVDVPWHQPEVPEPRPGEGDPRDSGSPVNWHEMEDDEFSDTFGALCDFLQWAIPRWNFTTEQFPYHCWWQHTDILEEITAWWGLWQGYVRNPHAHIADALTFHERTDLLKQRLADTYRGRCRHQHETAPALPPVSTPDHSDSDTAYTGDTR